MFRRSPAALCSLPGSRGFPRGKEERANGWEREEGVRLDGARSGVVAVYREAGRNGMLNDDFPFMIDCCIESILFSVKRLIIYGCA